MLTLKHAAIGCNRSVHCGDWSLDGILAYGAGVYVALAGSFDESEVCVNKIFCTLRGHSGNVNCVRWASQDGSSGGPSLLVSGSVDCHIIVWRRGESKFSYVLDEVLRSHSKPVVCVDAVCHSTGVTLASASSDSTLKIWERPADGGKFTLVQTQSFGIGFVLGLSLISLNGSVILACGTEASKVDIFAKNVDKFQKVHSLSGHDDWVKDVHYIAEGSGCLLASCSQDFFIRLWKFSRTDHTLLTDPDELTMSEKKFTTRGFDGNEVEYSISLESVLIGHEDWVNSVRWLHRYSETAPLCLLSSSMDKTMVLWMLDEESGLWIERVRVGDVGGNSLGLYGAVFGPRGDHFIAHGYQGTFHLWKKVALDHWVPVPTVSGHHNAVQDVAWEPTRGRFLMSVSSDQSTRVHAPWMLGGKEVGWRELARPQIHGYDMQCVCLLSPIVMVTGADEKVLRAFHCPRNFVDGLKSISHIDLEMDHLEFPSSATLPSLGLSNKADCIKDTPISLSATSVGQPSHKTQGAPTEDQLHSTLWPEIHKLYGHSYEIFCVASSKDGRFVASACVASKQEFACILIWDPGSWKQLQVLSHHTLTVTQLAFSHCSQLLLAVSRDRTWSLWKLIEGRFCLQANLDKKMYPQVHSRIIWSCSWSHDDLYFATASRDKKVYFWSVTNGEQQCSVASFKGLQFDSAVTALDFAPCFINDRYLLSVGLESGEIFMYSGDKAPNSLDFKPLCKLDQRICHASAVKRLQWSPDSEHLLLASCSTDNSVRIFQLVQ